MSVDLSPSDLVLLAIKASFWNSSTEWPLQDKFEAAIAIALAPHNPAIPLLQVELTPAELDDFDDKVSYFSSPSELTLRNSLQVSLSAVRALALEPSL